MTSGCLGLVRPECRVARKPSCRLEERVLFGPLSLFEVDLPMSVDHATVRRVARLARLKVQDEDVPRLAGELNSILGFIEQLNEVDVSNVEPLTSVVSMKMKMRVDEVTDGHFPEKIVANAPAQEDSFFMVPKVVE
jgi:aspartyl-tRNA(Asn)/glutamyl-tRNA(Gln) amidotransferase subunit C